MIAAKISRSNKKLWAELIACFLFMDNEANKAMQLERLQCWCYSWQENIKYTVEMQIGLCIQVILRLFTQ
jgi:hypothetical protein